MDLSKFEHLPPSNHPEDVFAPFDGPRRIVRRSPLDCYGPPAFYDISFVRTPIDRIAHYLGQKVD